jgi:UDP:flavonoid glycosyltransferase YjiC (YdhE family)
VKVVLLAVGSRGDVAPMVALGRELSGRGEPVTVVTLADYVPLVTAAGLHPATVAVSMAESVAAVSGGTAAVSRSVLAYTRGVSRWLAGIAPAVADTTLAAVRPGDLIVAGLLSFDDAAALAEAPGCRVLNALFAPLLPTAHGPSTTAESLLSGRPTGVVATGADQPYFGRRVAELGAGPPPLRRRDLTVDRLATLISALTGPDSSFRSYAGEIAAERGAAIAADHIVAHLRRTNPFE